MKKKKIFISFVFIVISLFAICGMYDKNQNKSIKTPNVKSNLAIMIDESGNGNYTSSSSIPIGSYVLNEEKTVCENGGKVKSYNNSTGQIGFSFLGSDRCTLYFDYYEDIAPVISNVTVKGKTLSASFSDDVSLCCYAITSDNSTPSEWIDIDGSSYILNTTIANEGTYYLWLKDSKGNIVSHDNIVIENYGYETILINNGGIDTIKAKGSPNFSKTLTASDAGMYVTIDDLGTSYCFRGAVSNNWVKFGQDSSGKDMYWRIIRINGDNTIRMIYTGIIAPSNSSSVINSNGVTMTGVSTSLPSTTAYNSTNSNTEHVGYQFILGQQHGCGKCDGSSSSNCTINNVTIRNSLIKQKVDKWYVTTTLATDTTTKNLIADSIFCNDRTASTTENGNYGNITPWLTNKTGIYYSAYNRLANTINPSLKCTINSDKFTLNSSLGNGALTYPVGLITADEAAFAGAETTQNRASYLHTETRFWTMTPYEYINDGASYSYTYTVNEAAMVNSVPANMESFYIRPVISLVSTIKLSGNGTYNNPYVVKE